MILDGYWLRVLCPSTHFYAPPVLSSNSIRLCIVCRTTFRELILHVFCLYYSCLENELWSEYGSSECCSCFHSYGPFGDCTSMVLIGRVWQLWCISTFFYGSYNPKHWLPYRYYLIKFIRVLDELSYWISTGGQLQLSAVAIPFCRGSQNSECRYRTLWRSHMGLIGCLGRPSWIGRLGLCSRCSSRRMAVCRCLWGSGLRTLSQFYCKMVDVPQEWSWEFQQNIE